MPFSSQSAECLEFIYMGYLRDTDEHDRGREQKEAAQELKKYPESDIDVTLLKKPQTNRDFERDAYQHLFEEMESPSPWEFPAFRNDQSESEKREAVKILLENLKDKEADPSKSKEGGLPRVRPFQNDALFQKLMELFLQED